MKSARRFSTLREQLEIAVRAMRPLLNRVVFSGQHAAALLEADVMAVPRRTVFASDSELQVLCSMSLDRIATEMRRLGFDRAARTELSDVWVVDERITLDVRFVQAESADANPWLEYATLLTVAKVFGDGTTARLSSAPALLALQWAAYLDDGTHPLESRHIEDIVRLIATCGTIEREITCSPPELRSFVATETARLLSDDSAPHAIRSALPDAAQFPAVARHVLERMRRIAALG